MGRILQRHKILHIFIPTKGDGRQCISNQLLYSNTCVFCNHGFLKLGTIFIIILTKFKVGEIMALQPTYRPFLLVRPFESGLMLFGRHRDPNLRLSFPYTSTMREIREPQICSTHGYFHLLSNIILNCIFNRYSEKTPNTQVTNSNQRTQHVSKHVLQKSFERPPEQVVRCCIHIEYYYAWNQPCLLGNLMLQCLTYQRYWRTVNDVTPCHTF